MFPVVILLQFFFTALQEMSSETDGKKASERNKGRDVVVSHLR